MTSPPTSDRKRRVWIKRLLFALILSPFLALVGAYYFLDSPPPEDSDLRPPAIVVADESNGLVLLGEAAAEIRWPEEPPVETGELSDDGEASTDDDDDDDDDDGDHEEKASTEHLSKADRLNLLSGGKEDWEPDLVAEMLELNRSVLEKLDRAIEMESFAYAPITEAHQSTFRTLLHVRKLYMLSALRVREREVAADGSAALKEGLRLVRLGRRLEEAGGPIINYLVASAISSMARQALVRLLAGEVLGLEDLKSGLRELDRLGPARNTLRTTIRAEYAYQGLIVEEIAHGEIPNEEPDLDMWAKPARPIWPWRRRCFFLPNHFKRFSSELCREILSAVPPAGPWRSVDWQSFLDLAPNRWLPVRNGVGLHGVSATVGAYRHLVDGYQINRVEFELFRLTLALKGFRKAQGRLPEKLEELVPEWIAEITKDPFDGQPLRYDRARRVIWSIGNDGKDSLGAFEPDPNFLTPDASEPTVKLPFE